MKNLALILMIFVLSACSKEEKHTDKNLQNKTAEVGAAPYKATTTSEGIQLDTFGFPEEVNGCSCYFAKNKEDFDQEKYIYADEYGKNAFLKISGVNIKIPIKENPMDADNFDRTIENQQYKIHITGEKIKDMEEAMIYRGKITVEEKNTGKTATSELYGECGC